MPRPLPLNEEICVPTETHCEMCGGVVSQHGPDRAEHNDLEIVRKLAAFASEDWKAAIVMLLYTAHPNATIAFVCERVRLKRTEVCEARDRAAEEFPGLAPMLALCTPRANAQSDRREIEKLIKQQNKPELQTELL